MSLHQVRASDAFALDFGEVVDDYRGVPHVFVGHPSGTRGPQVMFVETMEGKPIREGCLRSYQCAFADTALKRFPGLILHLKAGYEP